MENGGTVINSYSETMGYIYHARIQEFSSWGRGGGLTFFFVLFFYVFFFLVFNFSYLQTGLNGLFQRKLSVAYIIPRFQGGPTFSKEGPIFSRGGGGRGSKCLFLL